MSTSETASAGEAACPGAHASTPEVSAADPNPVRRPRRIPGRAFLTWLIAFGTSRWGLRIAARRGDLSARMVVEPELRANPYDAYDQIRARGPIASNALIAATATYSAANKVLRSDAFGVAGGHGELPPRVRRLLDVVAEPGALGPLSPPSMLAVDPPEHTQYRRRVSRVFTPRAVAGLQPQVQRAADDLLDPIVESGARGFDLVSAYAARLPIAVISDILGVPQAMHEQVREWGDGAAVMLDPGLTWKQYRTSTRDLHDLYAWFDEHVEHVRRNPGDDLLSRLALLDGSDRLSDLELRATGLLVLGAGFETTVNLISNAVALLDENPDQLAILRGDPDLWPNAVEEVLRMESPVQLTLRQAYAATEVDGAQVSSGDGVLVMLAGANRDPDVFEDPSRFDVRRHNAGDHLAFSSGVHYCLGASLARMEATIALRSLYERFPDLTVTGPAVRRPTRVLRGFESLPVSV